MDDFDDIEIQLRLLPSVDLALWARIVLLVISVALFALAFLVAFG